MEKLLTDIINLEWITASESEDSDNSIKKNLLNIYDHLFKHKLKNGQSYLSQQELFMIIVWDMMNDDWSKKILFYSKNNQQKLSGISTYLLLEETGLIPGTASTVFKKINKFPRFVLTFSLSEGDFSFEKDKEYDHIYHIYLSSIFTIFYNDFINELNKKGIKINNHNYVRIQKPYRQNNLFEVVQYDKNFIDSCLSSKDNIQNYFKTEYLLKFMSEQKDIDKLVSAIADDSFKTIRSDDKANIFGAMSKIVGNHI